MKDFGDERAVVFLDGDGDPGGRGESGGVEAEEEAVGLAGRELRKGDGLVAEVSGRGIV